MTEEEWLASADSGILLLPRILQIPQLPIDPYRMLRHVADQYTKARKRRAGDRRLRLFACACCRRHWPMLSEAARGVVDQAEAFADGRLSRTERHSIFLSAAIPHSGVDVHHPDHLARVTIDAQAIAGAIHTVLISENLSRQTPPLPLPAWGNLYELGALVRDIFGNPFRAMKAAGSWRTTTVLSLVNGIYDEKAFDRLPILADAIQDAGCDNDDILNHCRQPGVHVRGCWVVDLVSGKA